MPKYTIEEGKGIVKGEIAEPKTKFRRLLSKRMKDAWTEPESEEVRSALEEVGQKVWRDQILEAIKTTKYDKELEARAKEVELNKRMAKAWGKE